MIIIYLLLSVGLFDLPITSGIEETSIDSKIEEVMVFQNSARVTRRTIPFSATKNTYTFKIENVSPYLDKNSLQVKLKGDGYISQVKHRKSHLHTKELSLEIKTLTGIIKRKQDSIAQIELMLKSLSEHENLLKSNMQIRGSHENLKAQNLKEITAFYSQQIKDILFQREASNILIATLKKQQTKLTLERNEISPKMSSVPNVILITVVSPSAQKVSVEINYQVANAGWFSSYHLRAKDTDSPLALVHFANVYQHTGEEWNDVKLSLTNENDRISKNAPSLQPFYIPSTQNGKNRNVRTSGFYSNSGTISGRVIDDTGLPLIGANVILKNSTLGTITDIDGHFEMVIPPGVGDRLEISYLGYEKVELSINGLSQIEITMNEGQVLDEIVVTSSGYSNKKRKDAKPKSEYYDYSVSSSSVSETILNFSFVMDTPYSIKDDGKKNEIAIRQIELDASYKYKAVPKLSDKVYLMAFVDEWEDKNLLKGNMNLYFEGAYIGTSLLDPHQLKDSISISLGVDSNIKIERDRNQYFTKKKFLSSKKYTELGYTIDIKSAKDSEIDIQIWDQIPISTIKDIKVTQKEITPGFILNEETGIGYWDFKLGAKEQKKLRHSFELKYPEHYHFNF